MRSALLLLLLAACAGADTLAPAQTTAAECRGPVTADPSTVVWRDSVWLYTWRENVGHGAWTDVLLPASGTGRWLVAAELTNYGTTAIRSPFLRVARAAEPEGGVVVVGADVSPQATLPAGSAILWTDGVGVPIPPGWLLNLFVPPLPAGANLAVTLYWMACV